MKRKPLENPHFSGCGNCGKVPNKTLPKNFKFEGSGVHILSVNIDETEAKTYIHEDEYFILKEFNKKYKEKLDKAECAEIRIDTPLHDETYEYNRFDGRWYLVEQGQGYA